MALPSTDDFPCPDNQTPGAGNTSVMELSGEVGHYVITGKLGQGGMGEVYKAWHVRLQREVAIKFLLPTVGSGSFGVQRFLQEMAALGQLDHPHIVRATDAGEWQGRHYLVMEFLDGLNVNSLIKTTGPVSLANACAIVGQAASGLQYVYERGQVHRDLKPSNLFCTRTGVVKILDLGLVRLQGDGPESVLTRPGEVMGTYDYMAPEQARDAHAVDIRADLYSLGCTFYFVLTGRPPFAGLAAPTKLLAHAQQPPPSMAASRPDVPAALLAIVERLLAKQPADRFPTPAALIAGLQPWVDGADLRQLCSAIPPLGKPPPTTPPQQVVPVQELPTKQASPAPGPAPTRSWRLRATILAGVLFLLVGTVLAVWNFWDTTAVDNCVPEKPGTLVPGTSSLATKPGTASPTSAGSSVLEPGKWHPLLTQAPLLLQKPTKRHGFEQEKGEFWWETTDICLAQLGETLARDFDLEAEFHRSAPPAAHMGFFWGYHKAPDGAGKECYRYQVVSVRTLPSVQNLDARVEWNIYRLEKSPPAVAAKTMGSSDSPFLTFPTFRLTVQVRNDRLQGVQLNGKDVLKVSEKREIDVSGQGAFGLYGRLGAATVMQAKMLIHEQEK
jgi:serine/threonine protein kinase